jgi:hypothetical protein
MDTYLCVYDVHVVSAPKTITENIYYTIPKTQLDSVCDIIIIIIIHRNDHHHRHFSSHCFSVADEMFGANYTLCHSVRIAAYILYVYGIYIAYIDDTENVLLLLEQ